MADFEKAVKFTLENEGVLSNIAEDRGGLTKYGISLSAHPEIGEDGIRNLTLDQAKEIYRASYWKFDAFISQRVATKVFDMAVNMGPITAVRILQQSLSPLVAGPIIADGKIGPQTIQASNSVDDADLLFEIKVRQAKYYADLVLNKPDQRVFLMGWLRRAIKG